MSLESIDALEAGRIVLNGEGTGLYDEALDAIRKLSAALSLPASKLGAGEAWFSIETAPKDESWFLAYWPVHTREERVCATSWSKDANDGMGRFVDIADHIDWTQPTHWMPLPAAPGTPLTDLQRLGQEFEAGESIAERQARQVMQPGYGFAAAPKGGQSYGMSAAPTPPSEEVREATPADARAIVEQCAKIVLSWTPEGGPLVPNDRTESPCYWQRRCIAAALYDVILTRENAEIVVEDADKERAVELAHDLGISCEDFTSGAADILVRHLSEHRAKASEIIAALPKAGEVEPVAWLKEWESDGEKRSRIDRKPTHDAWLDALNPTITPLYATPPSVIPAAAVGEGQIIEWLKAIRDVVREAHFALDDAEDRSHEEQPIYAVPARNAASLEEALVVCENYAAPTEAWDGPGPLVTRIIDMLSARGFQRIESGHANTEAEAVELFAHLNCPSCGGSGHIDDVALPTPAEGLTERYREEGK